MKQLFIILAIITSMSLFTSCGDKSTAPVETNEFDSNLTTYELEGLWQAYVADSDNDGQNDATPLENYFLLFNDASATEYNITVGYGGADTIFWQSVNVAKTDENITVIITDANTNIVREININGYKAGIEHNALKANVKTYAINSENITEQNIVYQNNPNPGMLAYIGLFKVSDKIANDNELKYKFGTGEPVVLIHGFLGNAKEMEEMVDSLNTAGFGTDHAVYTYEYDYNLPIAEIVTAMKSIFDAEFTSTPPTLIGHSMGGVVSRAYILNGGEFNKFISLGAPLGGVYLYDAPINKDLLKMLFTAGSSDLLLGSDYINWLNSQDESAVIDRYYLISSQMYGQWKYTDEEQIPYWEWISDYSGEFCILQPAMTNAMIKKGLPIENDGFISNYSSNLSAYYDMNNNGKTGNPHWIDINLKAEHDKLPEPHLCPEVLKWTLENL